MTRKNILIIGFLFLAAVIPISAYLIRSGTTLTETQAEVQTTPKNLRISALSRDSFTVEWETNAEFAGYIFYGLNPNEVNFLGQDIKGSSRFKNHTIVVSNLTPNATYYYIVVSEEDEYQSEGVPFQVTTLK